MKDNKSRAKISPTAYTMVIIAGLVLLIWYGSRSGISLLRQTAIVIVFLSAVVWAGLLITRQYQFDENGLIVYWYGLIRRRYSWDAFLVSGVYYLEAANMRSGYYIVFSTKLRPLHRMHGKFIWPFSTFEIPYSEGLYNELKTHCTALTNNSANDTIR